MPTYTKAIIYNLALLQMKASVVAVGEVNEATRTLDALYDTVLAEMLEAGFWVFAMRTVQITVDPLITPSFGYQSAFNKPSDWVRTYDISLNESMTPPLYGWIEEYNLFFADSDPLYVRYVSNAAVGYGMDLTRWTTRFAKAVAFELAARAGPKATGTSDSFKKTLLEEAAMALSKALMFEALREPPKRLPQGQWNQGRFARSRSGRDGS
jgi:hypothetical protein